MEGKKKNWADCWKLPKIAQKLPKTAQLELFHLQNRRSYGRERQASQILSEKLINPLHIYVQF